jgi:hypothetical protein
MPLRQRAHTIPSCETARHGQARCAGARVRVDRVSRTKAWPEGPRAPAPLPPRSAEMRGEARAAARLLREQSLHGHRARTRHGRSRRDNEPQTRQRQSMKGPSTGASALPGRTVARARTAPPAYPPGPRNQRSKRAQTRRVDHKPERTVRTEEPTCLPYQNGTPSKKFTNHATSGKVMCVAADQ